MSANLLEDYKKSIADKNRAKLGIAGLFLLTVVLFAFLAWNSLNGFLISAVPEITALVTADVGRNSDRYLQSLNNSAKKVLPVYSTNFQSALQKQWPTIEKAGNAEIVELNHFAQKRWPDFEREINNIATAQEAVIKSELSDILNKGNAEKIKDNYTLAALNSYKNFVKRNFSHHEKVGKSLGVNLHRLIESEPDISSDVDMHEAFGLALEVFGLELQELAKK